LFARRYLPVVLTYLKSRWDGTPLESESDDAAQEVFMECFRDGGALARVDRERGEFRGFLYGVTRKVAMRFERKRGKILRREGRSLDADRFEKDEKTLSAAFDRAWAMLLLEEAALLQTETARARGEDALRRVELLGLRFEEDLPVREIARRWGVEAAWVHHQYAQAREEYKRALRQVVRAHQGGDGASVEEECVRILGLLD
jgi:RNA polymerase sigma-70 factor (ECF subfamily)